MFKSCTAILALAAVVGTTQPIQPGGWDITSTVVDFNMPGVPGFIVRMIRGKSKAEHKRIAAGEGIEALLAPDPQAHCRIDSQHVADGRYAQMVSCPQKRGEPLHIVRLGGYDAAGFSGRASVTGTTPKGPMSIVLDQRGARVGD